MCAAPTPVLVAAATVAASSPALTSSATCTSVRPLSVVREQRVESTRSSTETDAYTPHLKRVLKSYQAAATTSLHGPNSVRWTTETASEKEESVSPLTPSRPPIQQPPPLLLPLPKDRRSSGQRSSTVLEGETIACFNVGGEDRLCLPQILNTVLRGFTLLQINSVCDDLQIYCSRCTDDQLAQLKEASILPYRIPSCGLISKSDAERLCASLLHTPVEGGPKDENCEALEVYHECFGGCEGLFYTDIYSGPNSPCVRCLECRGMLSPRRFISHVHRARAETRTCHWGFSSANWRQYLLPVKEEPTVKELLDQLKSKFDKRKKCSSSPGIEAQGKERTASCEPVNTNIGGVVVTVGAAPTSPVSPAPPEDDVDNNEDDDNDRPTPKKVRSDDAACPSLSPASPISFTASGTPVAGTALHQHPLAALGLDPAVWYQWAAAATARSSAFKPWQTGLCGMLTGTASAIPPNTATVTASKLSGLTAPNSLHAFGVGSRTHRRLANGHSNSLDSTEDALSSTSTVSSMSGAELDEQPYSPAFLYQASDMSGLRRVLEQHNLNAKACNDILVEASRMVYGYQQLVDHLARQKRQLEKEVDHMKLSEAPSPQGRALASPAESELSKLAEAQSLFRVKEEPLEDDEEMAGPGDKLDRLQLQREGRRMLMA